MAKDYYEILGVAKSATRDDIKKAYKKLAKQYHPDLNKGDPSAEKKFKEVNEAAAILGDEEKRRQYDNLGHEAFTRSTKGGGFNQDYSGFSADVDFGDIFESFFGGGPFSSSFSSRRRGADLRYDVVLTLREAVFGVKRKIKLRRRTLCASCRGSGAKRSESCSACHGTGFLRQTKRTPFGYFQTAGPCSECDGVGQQTLERCSVCHGTGRVETEKMVEVDIPAGVEDGTKLRVPGEGEAGQKGVRPGDLYLFLSVEPDDLFERQGNDIHLEVPISFFQAVFGDEIEVPTLDGRAKLKLPAGTQSGTYFRLKGKGVPYLQSSHRGDQMVKVQVVTPKRLTKKQEELLQILAKEFGESATPNTGLFDKLKEYLR